MASSPSSTTHVKPGPAASSSKDANKPETPLGNKKRVLIIGAGCAGMSAAYSFSLSPEQFDVAVYDRSPSVGGSATSYQLPKEGKDAQGNTVPYPYGAEYINDGVQGASPVFYNTFKMFEDTLGFKATKVGMQISFGKGKDEFWSNVFPSELVEHFADDIKKVKSCWQIQRAVNHH